MTKMLEVEMPDGTIIGDVPEGTTQEELLQRYSLYQKEQNKHVGSKALDYMGKVVDKGISNVPEHTGIPGLSRRELETAVGYAEVSANMLSQVPGMIAGGIRGLVEAPFGRAAEGMESTQKFLDPLVYEPRSSVGQRGLKNFMEGNEAARATSGAALERGAKSFGQAIVDDMDGKEKDQAQTRIDAGGAGLRTAGEFAYDFVTNVLPMKWGLNQARRAIKDRATREKEAADFAVQLKQLSEAKKAEVEQAQYMIDLDNTMIKYPQDYQAPQLGLGGRFELPEDGTRGKARPVTQEQYDADRAMDRQMFLESQEAPLNIRDNPPFVEMPGSLEITQRGGGTAVFERPNVRTPDMPLESMLVQDHQPLRGPESMREGTPHVPTKPITPDPLTLPIDPITRITAIEHLSGAPMREAVTRLNKMETRVADIQEQMKAVTDPAVLDSLNKKLLQAEGARWKAMETVEKHMRAAVETAQKNPLKIERTHDGRSMVQLPNRMQKMLRGPGGHQRGVFDPDILKLPVNSFLKRLKKFVSKDEINVLQESKKDGITGLKGDEALAELFESHVDAALTKIRRRAGDGEGHESLIDYVNRASMETNASRKSELDHAIQIAKEQILDDIANHRVMSGRMRFDLDKKGPGNKQRGAIDADLLTFGIPALISKIGETATYKKFAGVFKKSALDESRNWHHTRKDSKMGWISPDEFHRMAAKRDSSSVLEGGESYFGIRDVKRLDVDVNDPRHPSEQHRQEIRPVVKNKNSPGLNDIPHLRLEFMRIRPKDGAVLVKVTGHEGRHRMDVFNELGLEKVPVRFYLYDRLGSKKPPISKILEEAMANGKKIILESEDGFYEMPFPGLAKLDPLEDGPKPLNHFRTKEYGGADIDLLANMATAGLAGLVKKGIQRFHKPEKTKPVTPKTDGKKPDSHTVVETAAGETRTLEQFKKDVKPQDIKDIPDTLATSGTANLANASFLAHFTENPLVKYTLDRVGNIMRSNNLMASMLKEGHLFGLKGLVSRTVDPNSPRARWDALSYKEKDQLSQIANEYGGIYELSRSELKTLGVSEKVVDAYKAFTEAYSKAIDDINMIRPEDPINKLPGYFTRLRQGDFKLSVIDKTTGDTVYSDLFWTKAGRWWDGRQVEAKLKEKFGDQYEVKKETIDRGQRGNPYNVATVPFEELMQTIGRNDPRYRAIESAIREIKGKRGFGRHAIHRRNIAGGELNPGNFWEAFESYVDSAYRYKSNVEMKKMASEFQYDMDIQAPNLKNWVNTYVDLAAGRFKPGWMADAFWKLAEVTTKAVTLGQTGPSAPTKALNQLNNYFMWKALFAYRPAFLIAQSVQPYAFAPQWIAHYETKGFKGGGISGATYDATKLMVTRPDDFKAFIRDYLVPRGGIDPTMIHQMDFFGTNEGSTARAARWITGHAPAQMIESFGRLETAALGYAFFKKAGLKGKELYAASERFVNDVMVDYTKQEQPSWVGRTGIVGQAAGPLSTFFTNFASTTMLFMKDIADNPGKAISYKPMAIHIAQTAIWAGLTGTLGAKVVDLLIETFKALKVLDPKFPTLTEAVMTSDLPDWAAFGGVSGVTGMNIGASMAAPDIHSPSANTFPGVKFLYDSLTSLWPVINPFGDGSTVAQRQKVMKTMLPNFVASMMDVYEVVPDTTSFPGITMRRREPGEVVPNPNKRGFGNTAPTAEDQTARMLGTRSLRETRELEGVRRSQEMQDLSNASKTQLVDLAADTMMYGEAANHDIGELVAKAGELGMPPRDFINAVKSAMQARMTDAATRSTGQAGPRTPAAQQRYEVIENFRQKESGTGFKKMSVDDGSSDVMYNKQVAGNERDKKALDMAYDQIIKEAKKLFPGNPTKQKQWVQDVMTRREMDRMKRKTFRPEKPKEVMM